MDAVLVPTLYVLRHCCSGIDVEPIALQIGSFIFEQPTWERVLDFDWPEHQILRAIQWLFARGYVDGRILCCCRACEASGRSFPEHVQTVLDMAAARGLVFVFRFLVAHSRLSWTRHGLRQAVTNGHLDIVLLMMESGLDANGAMLLSAMEYAVQHSQLKIVQYFDRLGLVVPPKVCSGHHEDGDNLSAQEKIPALAAKHDQLEIIQYLWRVDLDHAATPKYEWDGTVPESAAANGHRRVVCWLYENTPLRCSSTPFIAAFRHGDVELTRLIPVPELHITDVHSMAYNATKAGHYDQLKSLEDYASVIDQRALCCAAAKGDIELVKQWYVCTPSYWQGRPQDYATEHGHVHVVKYLLEQGFTRIGTDALQRAATRGHLGVIEYIHKNGAGDTAHVDLLWASVRNSHLELVRFLTSVHDGGYETYETLADYCIRTGDLDMLECLCTRRITAISPPHLAIAATRKEDDMRAFILDKLFLPHACDHELLHDAITTLVVILAARGKLSQIQWLESRYPLVNVDCSEAIERAIEEGRLDVLRHFRARGYSGFSADSIRQAAWWGHLHLVRFLHEECEEELPTIVMADAAWGGNLDVVKYLHQCGASTTTDAMDEAAQQGHLAILEYLYTHRTEGFTTAAMDQAAANGKLQVVQYLHLTCHAPCTSTAMDRAASNGHLEVVRFLHDHRTEGCTTNAMEQAVRRGHYDVVKFLHDNRTEGCSAGWLGSRGFPNDIEQYLRENNHTSMT